MCDKDRTLERTAKTLKNSYALVNDVHFLHQTDVDIEHVADDLTQG